MINAHIKDEKIIQHLLDGLLDNCADSGVLFVFKKLCRFMYEEIKAINIHFTIKPDGKIWLMENNTKL